MNEKASGRMRTSAYNEDVASDRRRRESLSRQTLCYEHSGCGKENIYERKYCNSGITESR